MLAVGLTLNPYPLISLVLALGHVLATGRAAAALVHLLIDLLNQNTQLSRAVLYLRYVLAFQSVAQLNDFGFYIGPEHLVDLVGRAAQGFLSAVDQRISAVAHANQLAPLAI